MAVATELGPAFARALADKDPVALRELLHPEIDFRGLTPRKFWEASDADGVLETIFGNWFDDGDRVQSLEHVESDVVSDRERVGYRLFIDNAEGEFVVEQQAYLSERDGRIGWMRVVCTGYRPR